MKQQRKLSAERSSGSPEAPREHQESLLWAGLGTSLLPEGSGMSLRLRLNHCDNCPPWLSHQNTLSETPPGRLSLFSGKTKTCMYYVITGFLLVVLFTVKYIFSFICLPVHTCRLCLPSLPGYHAPLGLASLCLSDVPCSQTPGVLSKLVPIWQVWAGPSAFLTAAWEADIAGSGHCPWTQALLPWLRASSMGRGLFEVANALCQLSPSLGRTDGQTDYYISCTTFRVTYDL